MKYGQLIEYVNGQLMEKLVPDSFLKIKIGHISG